MTEYAYCPRCGKPLTDTFLHGRARPTCQSCGYVVYLDPKVGAGTVVELNGKVVMVRRGMNPMRGHWSLPSGYVERDEAPDATAVRETLEETGLRVALDSLLNVYSFAHEGTGGRGVLVLYSAHAIGGELVAGDDAAEVGLFGPDELPPDVAFATHREALRDWQRAKAIVYRVATPDESRVVATMNAEHRAEIGRPYPSGDPGESLVFVAVQSGVVVGYALLTIPPSATTAGLDQIFVLPNYRRWGVASHLMGAAIADARARGLSAVLSRLPATSPALLVYVKAGFRIVGLAETYGEAGSTGPAPTLFLAYPLAVAANPTCPAR